MSDTSDICKLCDRVLSSTEGGSMGWFVICDSCFARLRAFGAVDFGYVDEAELRRLVQRWREEGVK